MENHRIWRRFERTSKDGQVMKFKIQDIPSHMFEKVIEYMKKSFLPEEPYCIVTGTLNNPEYLDSLINIWRNDILPQKLSIICLEDKDTNEDDMEIIGVNYLVISDKNVIELLPNEPKNLFKLFGEIESRYNVYETFNVVKYLNAFGLSVNQKYRGLGIGVELLHARTPICMSLGLKLTSTQFASIAGQKTADRAGFSTLMEIQFKDLEKDFDFTFPDEFKSLKIMSKAID